MPDEFEQTTEELTEHLRQLEEIIERLAGRIPGGAADSPSLVAESLRAEEKNVIADALLRAERRSREEADSRAQGPLTQFLKKPANLAQSDEDTQQGDLY